MVDVDEFKLVFQKHNHDGDGTIEKKELAQLLVTLDTQAWTLERAGLLISCMDQNSDGKIHLGEFVDWIFKESMNAETRAVGSLPHQEDVSSIAEVADSVGKERMANSLKMAGQGERGTDPNKMEFSAFWMWSPKALDEDHVFAEHEAVWEQALDLSAVPAEVLLSNLKAADKNADISAAIFKWSKKLADVNEVGPEGLSLLNTVAAESNSLEDGPLFSAVRALVTARADPNSQCPRTKQTPLHHLAARCHRSVAADCAGHLVKASANLTLQTKLKNTALMVAAQKKNIAVAEKLLASYRTEDGFQWAAAHGVPELCRKLLLARLGEEAFECLEGGEPLEEFNDKATSELRSACFKRKASLPLLDELIKSKADVRAENNWGEGAIHYASRNGDVDVIDMLLRHHADPNASTKDSCFPLHYAAHAGHSGACKRLVEADASPAVAVSKRGMSAWMVSSNAEVAMLLAPGRAVEDIVGDLETLGPDAFCRQLSASAPKGNLAAGLDALRLSEQLFFEPASRLLAPRESLLLRVWAVLRDLMARTATVETAPNHAEKQLLRRLLADTRGPKKSGRKERLPACMLAWTFGSNRESYKLDYDNIAEELTAGFAEESKKLRQQIDSCAAQGCPSSQEFNSIPAESYSVPEDWKLQWAEWREAVDKRRLRVDLPGMMPTESLLNGITSVKRGAFVRKSGVDCYLGLRRLNRVASIAEYSELVQDLPGTGFSKFAALNAHAMVAYAVLAQERFEAAMERLLGEARAKLSLGAVTHSRAPPKKFKRVWEKTLESKREEEEEARKLASMPMRPTLSKKKTKPSLKSTGSKSSLMSTGSLTSTMSSGSLASYPGTPTSVPCSPLRLDTTMGKSIGRISEEEEASSPLSPLCPDSAMGKTMGKIAEEDFGEGTLDQVDRRESSGGVGWTFLHPAYQAETHCTHILDLNRCTLVFEGTVQEQVVSLITLRRYLLERNFERDGAVVLREKNTYAKPAPGGYFDIKLFVLFDLGSFTAVDGVEVPIRILGELQLLLDGMLQMKKRMHVSYEVVRGSYDWRSSAAKGEPLSPTACPSSPVLGPSEN